MAFVTAASPSIRQGGCARATYWQNARHHDQEKTQKVSKNSGDETKFGCSKSVQLSSTSLVRKRTALRRLQPTTTTTRKLLPPPLFSSCVIVLDLQVGSSTLSNSPLQALQRAHSTPLRLITQLAAAAAAREADPHAPRPTSPTYSPRVFQARRVPA